MVTTTVEDVTKNSFEFWPGGLIFTSYLTAISQLIFFENSFVTLYISNAILTKNKFEDETLNTKPSLFQCTRKKYKFMGTPGNTIIFNQKSRHKILSWRTKKSDGITAILPFLNPLNPILYNIIR